MLRFLKFRNRHQRKLTVNPPNSTTTTTGMPCHIAEVLGSVCRAARPISTFPASSPKAMHALMIPEKIATRMPLPKWNSATAAFFCSSESSRSFDMPAAPVATMPSSATPDAHQGGDAPGFVGVAGQLAAKGGRDEGARGRAQPAADGRAQPHAQVADHQSPGQPAEAPHGPEQVAPAERFPGDLAEDREHVGRDERRQDPGRKQQARHRPDQPVALPRPLLDPLQREIEAGPAQPRQHVHADAQETDSCP